MAAASTSATRLLMRTLLSSALISISLLLAPACFASDSAADAYKLYQAKRYKEAAQIFDSCMSNSKPDANVCYYAAVCNQEAGNIARARSLYQQVTQLSPGSTIAGYSENILKKLAPSAQMTTGAASSSSLRGNSTDSKAQISGPDEARLYFSWSGQSMVLPVELNNRRIDMVLDTGAPHVCVGKNQLSNIGLQGPTGPSLGKIGGAANTVTQNFYSMNATVKVGPFVMTEAPVQVLEYNRAHPLLGQDFLAFFDYTIDRGARSIHFVKKGSNSAIAKTGYSIPFEYREGGNRIIVDGEINGKPAKFMMDTGNAATGITFHSVQQAREYGLPPPPDARTVTHYGVSGAGKAYAYYANRVKLGPIDRSDVTVFANMEGDDREPPLLGHVFFANWQYNVDLKERKIWLLRR